MNPFHRARISAAEPTSIWFSALLCLMAFLGVASERASAQTNFAILANDGVWGWFSDPRALFHNAVLYFGYVRNGDGRTVLSVFNPQTGEKNELWTSTFSDTDEFNTPSLMVRPDGRILAAYARHNTEPFFHFRLSTTSDPRTASAWGSEKRSPATDTGVTYANLFQLREERGITFNLVRNQNYKPSFFISEDAGNTWSESKMLLQTVPDSLRPYVKVTSDGIGRADILYTSGHPHQAVDHLYHVFYRDDAFRDSHGKVLKNFNELPLSPEAGTLVYEYNAAPQLDFNEWIPQGRPWCWDIANHSGNPACVFSVSLKNASRPEWFESRIYYYYARWTGTNWQKRFIAQAGRPLYAGEEEYAGGICIDPENPDIIYLSSNAADPFATSDILNVPLRANDRYELWRGVITDGGLTFRWEQITHDSTTDNLRPYVPPGHKGSPALIWFRGKYWSFSSFFCEIVGLFSTPLPRNTSIVNSASSLTLTNAAQVRELTQADAAQHYRVKLRGTVIAEPQSGGQGFALLDDMTGIYVRGPSTLLRGLQHGDFIEAEGVSDPGEFAPLLTLNTLQKLGKREIPPPKPVSFEQLITGRSDAQWVEVSGVVRNCEAIRPNLKYRMEVATGGGRLTVEFIGTLKPDEVIDAEVRLPGVSFYQVNKSRQVITPLLVIPRGAKFTIEKPAPPNPFETPVIPSSALFQFTPQGTYGHRVHLRGTVLHHAPGESLWIRDAFGGLHVQSSERYRLFPGDLVDILGFPARGEYSPMLEDAVVRKVSSGTDPIPIELNEASLALNHDSELIQISAKLIAKQLTPEGGALVFQKNDTTFRGVLRLSTNQILPEEWLLGSEVKVMGICSAIADHSSPTTGLSEPRSSQILLRSINDVIIVRPPPWWTNERVAWLLLGIAGGLLLTVGIVIAIARSRLREQAAERMLAEAQFTTIFSERNRMAREIHDTLAQGLGAISMQLEVAKSVLPADAKNVAAPLEEAHKLVRSSLADARNSIWNMRSQVLESNDLPTALAGILQQLTNGTGINGVIRNSGRIRRLPPVTENNLLRIGQEAVTNAVTHAKPQNIHVELEFGESEIRLRVIDDGSGFDVSHPPASMSGFGLVGMRERAEQLHARLIVESSATTGTRLELITPIPTQ